MARAPRRRTAVDEDGELLNLDPLDAATFSDQIETAGELSGMFDALRAYDQNTIKGVLFRKPPNGLGKYEWIEDLGWPFDMSAIMGSLKAHWGGGAYRLQILAGTPQKTRKVVEFNIADDGKSKTGTDPFGMGSPNMMMAFMQMQQENSRMAQAAADRQSNMMMTMMQNSTQQMIGMMTAVMGNREKAADFLPLLTAIRGDEPKRDSIKDTVETFATLKGLFKDGDTSGLGGLDADGLVDGALKFAGPIAGAIGKAFEARGRRLNGPSSPDGSDAASEALTGLEPAARPLMLARPATPALVTPREHPEEPTGRFPILNAVRPDIAYFFGRRHDPELAAEAVVSVLADVPGAEEMVNELVRSFAVSSDWKADLAAEGIDLRADPEWADHFLAALVSEWTDLERDTDHPERGAGDADDAEGDGEAGAAGVAGDGGPQSGGEADI